jgi:hypothetical protein
MVRSTECDEIIERVRCLGVVSVVRIEESTARSDVVNMELGSTAGLVFGLVDVTTRCLTAVIITLEYTVALSSPARISPFLSLLPTSFTA